MCRFSIGADIRPIDIDKLVKGDRTELRFFVDVYKRPLYAFLFQILKDHDLTDDVSQEVFIKVFKSVKKLKDRSTFKSWVFRIASNTALTELKKQKQLQSDPFDEAVLSNHQPDLFKVNFKHALDEALKHLSPTQKIVFTLRHINGNSTRESSEILNCSEGHVKKQLFLAVKKIRNNLIDKYPEMDWNLS